MAVNAYSMYQRQIQGIGYEAVQKGGPAIT